MSVKDIKTHHTTDAQGSTTIRTYILPLLYYRARHIPLALLLRVLSEAFREVALPPRGSDNANRGETVLQKLFEFVICETPTSFSVES